MKYSVPGSHGIWVTKDCDFLDADGEECDLPIIDNFIEIELFGELKRVDKTWLMNISIFGMADPKFWPYTICINLVGKPRGIQTQVLFTKPQYYNKSFRIVPGFISISVDVNGNVISTLTGKGVEKYITPHGYYDVCIWDPRYQTFRNVSIHRLVALAWVGTKDPATNHVVNHKDGNKLNNKAYNLEWTTHKKNAQHAVDTGLRPDACPGKAKDIYTQEVFEFPSIQALRTFLGNKDTSKEIEFAQGVRANKLYAGKYEIRVGNDTRPWVYGETSVNIEASRYIITVIDGEKTLQFNGTRSVIKHYKLWNLITNSADQIVKVLLEKHPDLKVSVVDQYESRPIEVLEVKTGNVTVFPTARSIEREFGICKSMVLLTTKRNGTKITHGYRMRYQSSDPWTNEVTYNERMLPRRIEITDKVTQVTTLYNSEKEVSRALNIDRKRVRRMTLKSNENDRWIARRINLVQAA